MLNEIFLGKLLDVKLPSLTVSDVHWKTQDSDEESILFYRIPSESGASSIFVERISNARFAWLILNQDHPARPLNSSVISEGEWPRIQEALLDQLYPLPSLKLLAVTGTNGKTTTADLVLQLGELCGKRGLSIGTLGVRENHRTILDFGLTSPNYIDLRKFLHRYGAGKDFCVLEASSHALIQGRLKGLKFDAGGWLSFSQDHLDYHKTMDEYFSAKMLIFEYLRDGAHVFVPAEQEELFDRIHQRSHRVSKARDIIGTLPLFFSARFNRNNLEVAAAMVEAVFDLSIPQVYDRLVAPDGRFYVRAYGESYIVVDFAHTPDALENICRGIREAFPDHRLKVLFGCGGDRDRTKRPQMGKIAERYAAEVYVTSDNPRSEDPAQIIDDILSGMSGARIRRKVDRRDSVRQALEELQGKEVLLLAGKGHEDYILIKGIKHPYSDIGEVESFLGRKAT